MARIEQEMEFFLKESMINHENIGLWQWFSRWDKKKNSEKITKAIKEYVEEGKKERKASATLGNLRHIKHTR